MKIPIYRYSTKRKKYCSFRDNILYLSAFMNDAVIIGALFSLNQILSDAILAGIWGQVTLWRKLDARDHNPPNLKRKYPQWRWSDKLWRRKTKITKTRERIKGSSLALVLPLYSTTILQFQNQFLVVIRTFLNWFLLDEIEGPFYLYPPKISTHMKRLQTVTRKLRGMI